MYGGPRTSWIAIAAHYEPGEVEDVHQWGLLLARCFSDLGIIDHERSIIEVPGFRPLRVRGIVVNHEGRRLPEVFFCKMLGSATSEEC